MIADHTLRRRRAHCVALSALRWVATHNPGLRPSTWATRRPARWASVCDAEGRRHDHACHSRSEMKRAFISDSPHYPHYSRQDQSARSALIPKAWHGRSAQPPGCTGPQEGGATTPAASSHAPVCRGVARRNPTSRRRYAVDGPSRPGSFTGFLRPLWGRRQRVSLSRGRPRRGRPRATLRHPFGVGLGRPTVCGQVGLNVNSPGRERTWRAALE